jgi:hypothetical protein
MFRLTLKINNKNIMSYYSTDVEGIDNASSLLIVENAAHLITYIYNNTNNETYKKRDVRVGLVIKILVKVKSNSNFPASVLQPVVDDIQALMADHHYLASFKNPSDRRCALVKELSLINKFIELDDTISLNTTKHMNAPDLWK